MSILSNSQVWFYYVLVGGRCVFFCLGVPIEIPHKVAISNEQFVYKGVMVLSRGGCGPIRAWFPE